MGKEGQIGQKGIHRVRYERILQERVNENCNYCNKST